MYLVLFFIFYKYIITKCYFFSLLLIILIYKSMINLCINFSTKKKYFNFNRQ
jgi:hypothetical protein